MTDAWWLDFKTLAQLIESPSFAMFFGKPGKRVEAITVNTKYAFKILDLKPPAGRLCHERKACKSAKPKTLRLWPYLFFYASPL